MPCLQRFFPAKSDGESDGAPILADVPSMTLSQRISMQFDKSKPLSVRPMRLASIAAGIRGSAKSVTSPLDSEGCSCSALPVELNSSTRLTYHYTRTRALVHRLPPLLLEAPGTSRRELSRIPSGDQDPPCERTNVVIELVNITMTRHDKRRVEWLAPQSHAPSASTM